MLYGYSDECCCVAVVCRMVGCCAVLLTYTVLLDAAVLFARVRFCASATKLVHECSFCVRMICAAFNNIWFSCSREFRYVDRILKSFLELEVLMPVVALKIQGLSSAGSRNCMVLDAI
jgi:hypothetical protein